MEIAPQSALRLSPSRGASLGANSGASASALRSHFSLQLPADLVGTPPLFVIQHNQSVG